MLKARQNSAGAGIEAVRDTRPWLSTGKCRIDDLVAWVYRDQKADRFGAGGHLFAGEAAAAGHRVELQAVNSSQILEHERLGCRIDRGAATGFDLNEVAELVHSWVQLLPVFEVELIQRYGRVGGAPKLPTDFKPKIRPAQWKVEPRTNGSKKTPGRAVKMTEYCYDGKGSQYYVDWCELIVSNTREDLLAQYESYKAWAVALNGIARMLADDDLIDFELVDVPIFYELLAKIEQEAIARTTKLTYELTF